MLKAEQLALPLGIASLFLGCLLGWAGRYVVIEPDTMLALCGAAARSGWCAARDSFIQLTFSGAYGITAVAGAAAAWATRRRAAAAFAVLALFAGGLGLYLYDTGWAATGVLAALLRLPRIGREPPDPREFMA